MRLSSSPTRWARSLALVVASAALVLLGLFSPVLLSDFYDDPRINWQLLSNAGQAYGALSALLSAGALILLGSSIILQHRELRHSREQAARGIHFDLMKAAIEDPSLREAFGADRMLGMTPENYRRVIYLNLLLNFWQMRWEFGDITEEEVRTVARVDFFSGELGRYYWRQFASTRAGILASRRSRRFHELMEEGYRAAVAHGPPFPARELPETNAGPAVSRGVAAALAVGAGVVAGAVLHRLFGRAVER